MNNDYEVKYFKAYYHFKNVPKHLESLAKKDFMRVRNLCAKIFNEHIDSINSEWDLRGKPAAFGPNLEDMNPEYIQLIYEHMQPLFDEALKDEEFIRITINEYGDLIGYLPKIKESCIWVDFAPIK